MSSSSPFSSVGTLISSLVLVAGLLEPAWGAVPAAVSGRVTLVGGEPAAGVTVSLVELRESTTTDESGRFRFEDVSPGSYLLEAVSPRYGRRLERIEVLDGEGLVHNLRLDVGVRHEFVVVSARPEASRVDELARPVAVVDGESLRLELAPTLGQTLDAVPGVTSNYFGPSASRPVIRGLDGGRIRVLEDGIGGFDASTTSPDHAVSFDPIGTERVEVVRGPATLLYGSSAVGGVINALDARIPDSRSDRLASGIADLALGSVSNERSGAAALRLGRGPFVLRGEYSRREFDDLGIPAFAESAGLRALEGPEHEEEEEAFGTLPNSAVASESAGVGAAYVGRSGFFGVSARGFDTLYGVPGGHAHGEEEHAHEEESEHEEGEEGPVSVDLQQRRLDFRGGRTQPFGIFRSALVRFGIADYEHVELEGEELGTTFRNEGWEGRLELPHRPLGALRGSIGLQFASRDFEAIGAEAFVPPTETRSVAVFVFEEVGTGAARGQLGLRYESQDARAMGESPLDRSFSGVSGSVGAVWSSPSGFGAGITLARSARLPNAEELYSNGPHLATRAFEVGDPDLDRENSVGFDVTLRRRGEGVNAELTLFANWFDGFIFQQFTGEEEDGLAVLHYGQADSRFYGAELETHVDLVRSGQHHLDLEVRGDFVRAQLTDLEEDLPRIPAARLGTSLHYRNQAWDARVGVRHSFEQDRTSPFELPSASFTFLNASVRYRLFIGETICDVILRGTNLTDAEGRLHTSFLKDVAPLPGRDLRLNARVTF